MENEHRGAQGQEKMKHLESMPVKPPYGIEGMRNGKVRPDWRTPKVVTWEGGRSQGYGPVGGGGWSENQ